MSSPWTTVLLFLSLSSHLPHTTTPISFEFEKFDRGFRSSDQCSVGIDSICLRGDASIDPDGIAQLTRNQVHNNGTSNVGWVYYSEPLKLWENTTDGVTEANFTTRFSFNIIKVSSGSDLNADGMAFFLLPYRFQSLPSWGGGCLGLLNYNYTNATCVLNNHSFAAVELDTYQNSWDPSVPHVGININSIRSQKARSLGAPAGQIYGEVTVSYVSVAKNLSVSLNYNNGSRVELWHAVDLSTVLPSSVTVGVSGSTGISTELNQLKSWRFHSTSLDEKITPAAPSPSIIQAPEPQPGSTRNDGKNYTPVGVAVGVVCLLIIVCFIVWFFLRARISDEEEGTMLGKGEGEDAISEMDEAFGKEGGPRRIPFQHVVDATGSFDNTRKIGYGASGTVYRGFLQNLNRDVAVKRVQNEDVQRTRKEYMAEVKAIGRLSHRHLVQLLGWCHEKGEFLLIYEFMTNLSLDGHLFTASDEENILLWIRRYNIVLQVASALLYLHEEWDECIVHRDIKTSNIMLDGDFNAKLGDFGVARLTKHGFGLQTTLLCGTIGYIAPECFQTGRTSKESDVYAFGIVTLELASGRKTVEPNAKEGEVRLVDWVWNLFGNGLLLQAADPRLSDYDHNQMERMLVVGLWCAHPDLRHRPSIRKAMAALNFEDVKIDLPLQMPVANYVSPAASKNFSPASSSTNTTSSSGNVSAYAASTTASY